MERRAFELAPQAPLYDVMEKILEKSGFPESFREGVVRYVEIYTRSNLRS